MPKVFISYSRTDESFARQLASSLSGIGVDIWLDVDDIPAGMNWSSAIQEGLNGCDAMIVVVSPESMRSRNVAVEWQYFWDQEKLLIPVVLRSADIHFQLRRIQNLNFEGQPYDTAFSQLVGELRRNGLWTNAQTGSPPHRSVGVSSELSILIPMFNEEAVIGVTLDSLVQRRFQERYRIVVCDDESTDSSVKEASLRAAQSNDIAVIENKPNGRKIGAVRTGLSHITTPYVLLLDADTLIAETHEGDLDSLVEEMRARDLAAVGFRIDASPGNLIESLQRLEYRIFTDALRRLLGVTGCLTGHAVLWKVEDLKTVLAEHSGIFEGDDLESTILAASLRSTGQPVDYDAERLIVTTTLKPTLGRLIQQRSRIWDIGTIHVFFDRFRSLFSQRSPLSAFFQTFFLAEVVAHPFRIVTFLWLFPAIVFDSLYHFVPGFRSSTITALAYDFIRAALGVLDASFIVYCALTMVGIMLVMRSRWGAASGKLRLAVYFGLYMFFSCYIALLPLDSIGTVQQSVNEAGVSNFIVYSYWGTALIFSYWLWYGACAFLIIYRARYSREPAAETLRQLAYAALMPFYYGFLLIVPRTLGFGLYLWRRLRGSYAFHPQPTRRS